MPADGGLLAPGRVARMRERLWRIDYVDGDLFGATPLDGRDNRSRRFDQRLEALSEGSMPLPSPEALGDERLQKLLLSAQRFALVHGTAPILGLQRSRAIPTDFQIVPLLMAAGSERVRLLIADDVGTGKTIEAGLVLSELMARGKARRVLVVVPANLREQWRDALDHFFHIESTIVSGALMPALERRLLPGQSVWGSHAVVIASVDYVKDKAAQVCSYPWDVVLIDEAHMCAKPHQVSRGSTPDMERWRFAEQIAPHARHLLLLTATPHNGYSDSYASLFTMLDPSLVRDTPEGPVVQRQSARARHVVQRQRRDIEEWYEQRGVKSPFPQRDSDEQVIDLNRYPEMEQLLSDLRGYAAALFGAGSAPVDRWIAAHLQKRALSSPYALRISIENRRRSLEKRAASEPSQDTVSAAREATTDALFAEDDEGDAARLDQTASTLSQQAEMDWLDRLIEAGKKVTPAKDPKLQEILRLIPKRMQAHPESRRVLVFTKYKDTLDYLVRELKRAATSKAKTRTLPDGVQIFSIDGKLTLPQRQRVFAEFERADCAVLVATDCISEGLNLQRACAELIHNELSWNPNRLEQRNGRIDRYQQREPFVGIRTLVYNDPLDAALLYLIDHKARAMREAYGFVPPFLANSDILLHLTDPGAAYQDRLRERRRNQQMALDEITSDEQLAEMDEKIAALTETAADKAGVIERIQGESFYGQADVSLASVEAALNQSRNEIGTPDTIRDFISSSIRELHGATITNPDGTYSINPIPAEIADTVDPGGRYSFDPLDGMDDPDVDIVDLAHPLARRLIDLTLERSQLPECAGRVAARISPDADAITIVAHVLFRYVAQGTPPVLLEEVVALGWRLRDGSPVDPGPLLAGPGGTGRQHHDDIINDARKVLTDPALRPRLQQEADTRATALARRHADLTADWAAGLDQVEATSFDVVAITIVYPQVSP